MQLEGVEKVYSLRKQHEGCNQGFRFRIGHHKTTEPSRLHEDGKYGNKKDQFSIERVEYSCKFFCFKLT